MKTLIKKLGALAVIFTVCAIGMTPSPAHALVGVPQPTIEVGPEAAGVAATAAASGLTAANTTIQNTIMQALNGLAWSVAKMTIQSLTRSTVNWINSGFHGSPAFVSDLKQNLNNLSDAVAENFFQHLDQESQNITGFNLKSPFQDQLNAKLRNEYYRTTSSWGLDYTLSQQSKDPSAFLNGDFHQGGYNAYFSATQNPANNPFGAYLAASNQLWSQIDSAAQARKSELLQSGGFLSWRGNCNTPPASASAGKNTANGNKTGNSSSGKDISGKNTTTTTAGAKNTANSTQAVSLSTAEGCPFNAVRTPGSLIENALGITATSPLRQLELADSINEIVAALMGQLVNQVLGPGGLIGVSQPSSGGGQSYLNQATDSSQYSSVTASLSDGVVTSIQNDRTAVTTFRSEWQKVLDAANAAQKTCGTSPDITDAIDQATAGIAKADKALPQTADIESQVKDAAQTSAVDKGQLITKAIANYQSYLATSSVPTATEYSNAKFQSSDTSNTSDPTSQSLYTKMQNLQQTCSVRGNSSP